MSRLAVPLTFAAPPLVALLLFSFSAPLSAQEPVGTIEVASATIAGTLSLTAGRALVGANAIITAHDRTATLALSRGGEVMVCSTSALHAARGGGPVLPAPLLLALDRGAVEIHMAATTADTILTPDLRFTIATPAGRPAGGLLDLRMRVAANGDTCVENRGSAAPTLEAAEQFGSGVYQVHPNQHLLFEHGSLREVVDGETSPCGCPPPPVLSASESGISTDVTRAARPGARVADDPDEVRPHDAADRQHPFPAAESQGLTASSAAASVPQAPAGQPHAQVAATLAYNADSANGTPGSTFDGAGASSTSAAGNAPASPSKMSATAVPTAATAPPAAPPASSAATSPPVSFTASTSDKLSDHEIAQSPLPPPAPSAHTISRRIGHFFRHLFSPR